jgi:hypothetical protein
LETILIGLENDRERMAEEELMLNAEQEQLKVQLESIEQPVQI